MGNHEEIELYLHMRANHGMTPDDIVHMRHVDLIELHDASHNPSRSLGHHATDLSVSRVTGETK